MGHYNIYHKDNSPPLLGQNILVPLVVLDHDSVDCPQHDVHEVEQQGTVGTPPAVATMVCTQQSGQYELKIKNVHECKKHDVPF